jgi:hypothetical protein
MSGWPIFDFSAAPPYQQKLDYQGGTFVVYIGWATPGASTANPVWKIRKFTYDANNNVTAIQYANADVGFTQIWDNRASLTYK